MCLLVKNIYNFWYDTKEKPVDLQRSQQEIHDQKTVEEPRLSRSVLFDPPFLCHMEDVGPQLKTHVPPPDDSIIQKCDRETNLTKSDDHTPQRSSLSRKVYVKVAQDQKDRADFRASPKENGVVMDHLKFERHPGCERSQQMMRKEDGRAMFRHEHRCKEIEGLENEDSCE